MLLKTLGQLAAEFGLSTGEVHAVAITAGEQPVHFGVSIAFTDEQVSRLDPVLRRVRAAMPRKRRRKSGSAA